MKVRIVRVLVPHRLVTVPVRVRRTHRPGMRMVVMLVVNVRMFVLERFVRVFMIMSLS